MAPRKTPSNKKFFATRDFTDAGLEKNFALGDDVTNEDGIDNYVAAGLASDQQPLEADPQPATPAA